ncbi:MULTISPECIES: NAD-dependent epimerase/dehydratase family protein [unclassified Janthinobacterium]|uniref:NAD-dependent epimerase/dehydratase family protein n=1 Tax=unclassified Janthinobacterium TaxID=2610881 RepID=UPI00034C769C|nr:MULTISPECIES: NAD(P)-dependent oxidoreductase [unclassified Janthinobacterium]MEC5159852.1 uronate dehydrogenase [Janthinobacterium sp. CG_S6]
MTSTRVLVTGAAGAIGSAFWHTTHAALTLRLADIRADTLWSAPHEAVALDVTDYASCLAACKDIDVVLHLAGDPSPDADFHSSLLPTNIVGTYNIFSAAQAQGCRRVVFASSAQAVEGYPLDVQVNEAMAPRPKNMYGASKAFGEGVAASFAHQFGMTTLAVRIANVADFQPGQSHSPRDVAAFISERDVVQLLARCVEAELHGYHVVHGVSDNRYKRLAIDATRALLQYAPADDAFDLLNIPGGARPRQGPNA